LSALTIQKDPIFDVTKITVFSRASHNANSPPLLHFTFTVVKYLLVYKDLASNHPVCREIARD